MKQLTEKRRFRLGVFMALLVLTAIAIFLIFPKPQQPVQVSKRESDYAILSRLSFNQPRYYPITQTVPSNLYRPIANWVGRLILPTPKQLKAVEASGSQPSDWVWLEVQQAPTEAKNLLGKVVRLEWSQKPEIQGYVQTVTQDVKFTPPTVESESKGNVHPGRLNGRTQVGPLQSLAGARPNDDAIVTLENVSVATLRDGSPILQIDREPVLATGRFYGLVQILEPDAKAGRNSIPKLCPGKPPCPSEFFRVRHYNSISSQFDGAVETIRIPQQSPNHNRIFPSTPRQLEASGAGKAGWYIYGAKNAQGVFVVQAIEPRSLFQLKPDQVVLGNNAGLTYINSQNWQNTEAQKGIARTVLVDPTATQPEQALSQWREGDRAIVLHNFGGIGGKKAEPLGIPNTITGHFAYGVAQVVRDPLTNELQFDIEYQQVYTHNPNGIIAATHTWADYMGNLQWGWLATRPVSDAIIKFDAVTQDYNFDGITLSPIQEFLQQLQVMMARYRVGDGTGSATVTPATSCIQDSSQALYATIKQIKQQVSSTPEIQAWLKAHPDDPQTLRFQQLVALGEDIEQRLIPLGILRADWEQNANALAGTNTRGDFTSDTSPFAGLTTWRTMVPRQAHDELSSLFWQHGAKVWFLRTNQVGGWDADIAPLAPTALLGQLEIPVTKAPIASILFTRVFGALNPSNLQGWLITVGIVILYGAIALPIGFSTGFLRFNVWSANWLNYLLLILRALLSPALSEEFVFRVLLIPHPEEGVSWQSWVFWAVLSLFLFIIYHPLNAKSFFRDGSPTFFDPVFLTLAGLLGLACTVAYGLTGSLWAIAFIHWIVVVIWLLGLGGLQKLLAQRSQQPVQVR
jgi:predicted Abi (CAAX) family protease